MGFQDGTSAAGTSGISSPGAVLTDAQGLPYGGGDAFGRVRTSEPFTIFDSKQTRSKQPLLFSEKLVSDGNINHLPNEAASLMSVSASAGSRAVRQSFQYFNYQPGKSQQVMITFVMGSRDVGVMKCAGYYDDNDGLFFKTTDTTISFVKRSSTSGIPVDIIVEQADWNCDKMDGTGPSGIILDPTKAQIFSLDFEWLGVGKARLGFVIGGVWHCCHTFNHANFVSEVYMMTPNLPIRWEIISDGSATGTMKSICCTVLSEGGQEFNGSIRSVSTARTSHVVNADLEPVLSVRLAAGQRDTVQPKHLEVMCSSGGNLRWVLSVDPVVTGGTAASFVTAGPDSVVEYDISQDGVISPGAEGFIVASGYLSNNLDLTHEDLINKITLAADIDGVAQIWTLSCQNASAGSNETVFASLSFEEF